MSEKRFVIDEEGISDNKTDKWYCWKEEVVDLLNEQQSIIHRDEISIKTMMSNMEKLEEENEQLKQQLLYDGDDVCGICKHEYLTPSRDYFIGRCEKGHEECSTEDIKYCEDFKLKEADDE